MSLTDLAERVGLTLSPAHRRVKRLEEHGVIQGYRAVVDPAALGVGFEAVVFVQMRQEDRATIAAFEDAVADVAQVVRAQRLLGDPDYVLTVRAVDINDYTRLTDEVLSSLPGVHLMNSSQVAKNVVVDRPFQT